MKTVRYILFNDVRFLWTDLSFARGTRIYVPWPKKDHRSPRFCNILEVDTEHWPSCSLPSYKVRVCVDEEVYEGWTALSIDCIGIYNKDLLLDGRFNV